MSENQIISFDYDSSPYGQKCLLLLEAAKTPYVRVDVPAVLPRPQLEALGITYRRIPVLAIGKDVFCDTSLIIDALVEMEAVVDVEQSKSDKAYEAWGNRLFQNVLGLVPEQAWTPEFMKDRETVFSIVRRPDIRELRPSALGGFLSALTTIENEFLAGEHPYIAGETIGLADVHVAFVVRWVLQGLGISQEKGFQAEDFPRTYMWLESLPKPSAKHIEAEEAKKIILGAEYAMQGVKTKEHDALKGLVGRLVTVESFDADPGAHLQYGTLLGADEKRVVIALDENDIRLHFPRLGYVVKPAMPVK